MSRKTYLSRVRRYISPFSAIIIISIAMLIRLILLLLHWPSTNSDEGTMYIMAYNIAYHGEWPLNFYHQDYMGPLEAYLGAIFFHISGGPSYTALRLGVFFLVTLFFISLYHFTRLVYTKRHALITISLLSVGSIPVLTRQIIATGGSTQTLLFGTLAMLFAYYLSYTNFPSPTFKKRFLRLLIYASWGFIVGIGLWSDMVIIPVIVTSCLLLILFCWKDIFIRGKLLIILSTTVIGYFPCILYNLQRGKNPVITLLKTVHGTNAQAPHSLFMLWHNVTNTLLISLPTATGLPFCPTLEYPFLGDNTPPVFYCQLIQSFWGIGYVTLALIALLSVPIFSRISWIRNGQNKKHPSIDRQYNNINAITDFHVYYQRVQRVTRFSLAGMVFLTLLVYIPSSAPVDQPGYHARYLVGLLIATPAIIAPLSFNTVKNVNSNASIFRRLLTYFRYITLIALIFILSIGTYTAFLEIPQAHIQEQRYQYIVHQLKRYGVTRFHTDYWICYNLMIASHFSLICTVIDRTLSPEHERVHAAQIMVNGTKNTSWMCAKSLKLTMPGYDCLSALTAMIRKYPPSNFHRYDIDGYVLYKNTHPEIPDNHSPPPLP